jgi:hypothetical protein
MNWFGLNYIQFKKMKLYGLSATMLVKRIGESHIAIFPGNCHQFDHNENEESKRVERRY